METTLSFSLSLSLTLHFWLFFIRENPGQEIALRSNLQISYNSSGKAKYAGGSDFHTFFNKFLIFKKFVQTIT